MCIGLWRVRSLLSRPLGVSVVLACSLAAGCSSAPPEYREVDVELPSGELKKSVRVLTEEDLDVMPVSVICREFRSGSWTGSRLARRPREICASYAYWSQWTPEVYWVHPEQGTANLADDFTMCRRSSGGFEACMENLGYSTFSID